MAAYLPFAFAPSSPETTESQIQVAISPDVASYRAGDVFRATVSFRIAKAATAGATSAGAVTASSTRPASRHGGDASTPRRLGRVGQKQRSSSTTITSNECYSPGADMQFRAPIALVRPQRARRDGRRTQSLATSKGLTPQEMVWALGRNANEDSASTPMPTSRILWATARLVGQFHPNNAYIPPDPLLPLRSLLLHQPVGSGSMENLSPWKLSFGTGALGNSSQPSLTGSLFGLAKGLVKAGGSLEEERKRVWNMKDLPVFEPAKELLGVDIAFDETFEYVVRLPTHLPPSYRGKAFRFTYRLVVNIGSSLGNREVAIPVRIWGEGYDVLKPMIHQVAAGSAADEQREAFSRAVFDIVQDGRPIATLTLTKSTYRVGESVIGIVVLHQSVERFCALLESHETIPETLLPPATKGPNLLRIHAEHVEDATHMRQFSFALDIPSDATQDFVLRAGEGEEGGLKWSVKVTFWGESLVHCPIPIRVLRGNTNYVVRPIVYAI